MTRLLLSLVRLYQRFLSPLTGGCCRFEPSCSRYCALCLKYHGAFRGSWLTLRRLVRCNPLFAGGFDPPPLPPHASPEEREPDWNRIVAVFGNGSAETPAGEAPHLESHSDSADASCTPPSAPVEQRAKSPTNGVLIP